MEMNRPSQCRMCKRMFRSKQGLAAHVQTTHLTSKSPREPLNNTSSRKSSIINSSRKSTEINSSSSNLTPDSSSPRQATKDSQNKEKKVAVITPKDEQILDTIDLSFSPIKQTTEDVPCNNLTPNQVPNNICASKQVLSTSEIKGTEGSPSPVKLDVEIASQDHAPSTDSSNQESKNLSEDNLLQHSSQTLKRKRSEPDLIESTPVCQVFGPPTSYSSTTAVNLREEEVIRESPTGLPSPIKNSKLITISVYIPDSSSTTAKANVLETNLSPIRYSLSALESNLSNLEDKEMTLEINNNTLRAKRSCKNNLRTSETDSSTMDLITLETSANTLEAQKNTLEADEITLENDWTALGDHKNTLESVDDAIRKLLDFDLMNSSSDNMMNITLDEDDWLNDEKPKNKQSHITLLNIMDKFESAERDFKTALGSYNKGAHNKEASANLHEKYVEFPFKSSKIDDEIIQLDSSDGEEVAPSISKPNKLKASTLKLQGNKASKVKNIICRFCPLSFKSKDTMTSHIEKSHQSEKNKIIFNTFGEIFQTKQSLNEHDKVEHSFEEIVID